MNGQCLCGKVKWQVTGEPVMTTHCHCTICRKVHGAAFATYSTYRQSQFSWVAGQDVVTEYKSSSSFTRRFCSDCGSIVPDSGELEDEVYVPTGCLSHDTSDIDPIHHIFVADKASWYDIGDDLPQHPEFENPDDGPVVPGMSRATHQPDKLHGSCQCNAVAFEITMPFKVAHHCHCQRCQRARSAAFTSNGFTPMDAVHFLRGEDLVRTHELEGAKTFAQAFCTVCGSGMPRLDPNRQLAVIPLACLDDMPADGPVDHIFVGSKAPWDVLPEDGLPRFDEGPPPA